MKNRKLSTIIALMMAALLALTCEFAVAAKDAKTKPVGTYGHTPEELAARRDMVRKQQAQRITQKQRQTAADAYKAERLKVYNAKQAVKNSQQPVNDNK